MGLFIRFFLLERMGSALNRFSLKAEHRILNIRHLFPSASVNADIGHAGLKACRQYRQEIDLVKTLLRTGSSAA